MRYNMSGTGGAQPMSKIYSDYHYHIVYNGEIYNTDDLRHKLTTLGDRKSVV